MNLNLTRSISVLSRMGISLDINSFRATIINTSIVLTKKGSSVTIKSNKLEEMDFGFGIDTFNKEYLIQAVCQAMLTEASERSKLIMEGIYNSVVSSKLNLNNIYIENPENNTTAVILPSNNSVSITVFQGPVINGAVKCTMILPLSNDPIRYMEIINSLM